MSSEDDKAIVEADVARYGDALQPGAAKILGNVWQGLARKSPEDRAEAIADRLEGAFGSKYKNSEHVIPKLANGAEPGVLRQAIGRYGDRLRPDKVEPLVEQLSPATAGKSAGKVAGQVLKFLNSRDGQPFLNSPQAAKVEPFRQPDGRYTAPPEKGRSRSGF
jgi:hypothetical protein